MAGTVFRAACRLQEAANFLITAKTAEELGHAAAAKTYREIAERELRVAVEKLGYELTAKPVVDAARGEPVRLTIPAADVEHGDLLDGQFVVYAISHGPLENQLRFRDHNETAVAFRHATDLVVVERRAQA